jgi:hypothetical protein
MHLTVQDAMALSVGRVIFAWGNLDFRIESLVLDLWSASLKPNILRGDTVNEAPPSEGRSSHRLKLLRRYFLIVCEGDSAAISEFGKLQSRLINIEKIRSTLAHGLSVFGVDENGPFVSSWIFADTGKGKEPSRTDKLERFSLSELNDAAMEMDSLEKEFSDLCWHFNRSFIIRALSNHASMLPGPSIL